MAASLRLLCGLFIGILSLSACGGGGGTSAPAPAVVPQAQHGAATLSVFVPSASSSTSSKRRRDLPSSTQSVEIVVTSANGTALNPPVVPLVQNISATSPGCSSVSGGISCVIDVSVPYGSLLFAVVAFTGQNATGNAIAWGYTTATISATGSNAVSITTISAIVYFTMNLDGDISIATIDHSANTLAVANVSSETSLGGTFTYLPNGDVKILVTSSSEGQTAVGDIVYAREVPGVALVFFSTNTASPPAGGYVASGADWGIGTELTPCPTAAASYQVAVASIEGPQYQVSPNFNTAGAFQSGTATISLSGGSASLAFSGESYLIGGGPAAQESQTGNNGPCSGGIFAATSSSGQLAYDTQGVFVGANTDANQATGVTNGFAGFTVPSGSTIDISALTSGTYDGFLGYYNVVPTVVKGGSAINVSPAGSNTMNWCVYTNFEAGTVGTGSSNCATATFSSQPQPGIILGSIVSGGDTLPAVFAVSQISGKYVIFGVESISGVNFALFEH